MHKMSPRHVIPHTLTHQNSHLLLAEQFGEQTGYRQAHRDASLWTFWSSATNKSKEKKTFFLSHVANERKWKKLQTREEQKKKKKLNFHVNLIFCVWGVELGPWPVHSPVVRCLLIRILRFNFKFTIDSPNLTRILWFFCFFLAFATTTDNKLYEKVTNKQNTQGKKNSFVVVWWCAVKLKTILCFCIEDSEKMLWQSVFLVETCFGKASLLPKVCFDKASFWTKTR